ncbi:MAG: oxidoreductase, 2-nitropropane dioxygenase family protein [uncultured bacterium (gcode 4)]|uniref:Oxidoreductase, 2-nitropropane dioxygenase family protein n=1 Tax=uncultured bacterium (gcode 4) TaxID=1234023 RepID=K1XI63_9BACT|nr:MAG: oxidoreductase, 2-nitropropane dioxygenase family protein [uncultured bacterium (gcode 4)]
MEKLDNSREHTNTLPELKIWKHRSILPILQWGMGIWISTAELAWSVAREWWIWTLSAGAVHMIPIYKKYRANLFRQAIKNSPNGKLSKDDHRCLFKEANIFCIKEEIKRAKEISQWNGKIFINIMVASKDYNECVKAACEAGVDGIVSGAGLPKDLHKLTSEYPDIALVPILSQAKWVGVLIDVWNRPYEVKCEMKSNKTTTINGQKIENREWKLYQEDWAELLVKTDNTGNIIIVGDREYRYDKDMSDNTITLTKQYEWKIPDAIILEDPSKAGGHLWAIKWKISEVNNPQTTLEVAVPATINVLKEKNIDIPVIAAWWIVTRKDIDRMLALWVKWVQMWSLFLTTEESNAHPDFKNKVINATMEDVGTYNSSAFYPARYLKESLENEDIEGVTAKCKSCLYECLNNCALRDWIPGYAQICIQKKLVASTKWSSGKWLKFIWYPFTPEGENKITSLLKEIKNPTWIIEITFPTVKEIMEILQK